MATTWATPDTWTPGFSPVSTDFDKISTDLRTPGGDVGYQNTYGPTAIGRMAFSAAGLTIASPAEGMVRWNPTTHCPEWHNGSTWMTTPTPVQCLLYNSVTQSLASGSWTTLAWNSEIRDVGSLHDTATNNSRMTVPAGGAGHYIATCVIRWAANATGTYRCIAVLLNGVLQQSTVAPAPATGQTISCTIVLPLVLAAGDYVEVAATHDATSAVSTYDGTSYYTYASLVRVA